jgi:hypothetical protein
LLLQFGGQPALATGFRPCQYQNFHVRNAGSVRHVRQPCTASSANTP